ncbi:MAG: UDP-2,3-diacylglucosamine diphosphatase [Bacteroidota bacterium]
MKQLKKKDLGIATIHLAPLPKHKKIFFASDFHLGNPNHIATHSREKKIVSWLDSIQQEAHALFLLGDVFDFWFEYKHVIPKGFARLQGKLASFTDQHIPVYFLVGNRDLWARDYFINELNIAVLSNNASMTVNGKKFLVGHGDELSGNKNYRIIKKLIYNSPIFQWIFSKIHPRAGIPLARCISNKIHRRSAASASTQRKDPIFSSCKELIEPYLHHDFYIFGHTHLPYQASIHAASTYYNVGDWVRHFTYGVFDRDGFRLLQFAKN